MLDVTSQIVGLPTFSDDYEGKPLPPSYVAIPKSFKEGKTLVSALNYTFKKCIGHSHPSESEWFYYNFFGSDCCGGYAYIGGKDDIMAIQGKLDEYIKKLIDQRAYADHFYARWDMDDKALLLFYDNFATYEKLPQVDNVKLMAFGAWTNDEPLSYVLCNMADWARDWLIGGRKFNIDKEKHKRFYDNAFNLISKIGNCRKEMWEDFRELNAEEERIGR